MESFSGLLFSSPLFLYLPEKSVQETGLATISCGQTKRDFVFYEILLLYAVVPGKNLWYNDSK